MVSPESELSPEGKLDLEIFIQSSAKQKTSETT